jgi:hypothetical protein
MLPDPDTPSYRVRSRSADFSECTPLSLAHHRALRHTPEQTVPGNSMTAAGMKRNNQSRSRIDHIRGFASGPIRRRKVSRTQNVRTRQPGTHARPAAGGMPRQARPRCSGRSRTGHIRWTRSLPGKITCTLGNPGLTCLVAAPLPRGAVSMLAHTRAPRRHASHTASDSRAPSATAAAQCPIQPETPAWVPRA